ncbi:MAG: SDR family oxidoreductase [Sphingomonadales bacterium]|nr:SDR family oxidoreductase [Sphingomonadales bacterium]MBD3773592.1 SDR family oxidoreductase [Paracoccaceae bacterium]
MAQRKAIFVTGGGSGIGRAIAQLFAQRGWFVGLADINQAGMAETAALLPAGQSSSHVLDVRSPEQWRTALEEFAQAAGGRIDVVANNAGVPSGGKIVDMTEDEIDRCLDINLRGVVNGARAAYPHLLKTAPGSCLINTCSAAGLYGSAGMSIYCASKFGVRAVTESLDGEWEPDGILVRSIMPSFIDTPLLQHSSHAADNVPIRERVMAAGLEFTPVEQVAEAAWNAAHGKKLHTLVGKTARQLAFAAKWMPGRLRARAKNLAEASEG